MEFKGGNFDLCVQLREVGFPQLRKFQSMYYLAPDRLICIDDWSAIKSEDNAGSINMNDVTKYMIFKPTLQDISDYSHDFFQELIRMNDGSFMAYSNVKEDEEYIKSTGRTDPYIRAPGATEWRARANLFFLVKNKDRRPQLSSEELESSENKVETIINE